MAKAVRFALLLALGLFYLIAAGEHARVVNLSKARGDQSSYLGDAEQVYANWHGQTPATLIGQRNRMPVYAGFLALFYNPRMSDPEFFEVAKAWNIRLSLVLLALLFIVFERHLPPLVSTNLILVVAFGYFVFKAGYAQSELLFYCLFFLTFLSACYLLEARTTGAAAAFGALTGVLAGITHLTKAAVLPFMAVLLSVICAREAFAAWRGQPSVRSAPGRLLAGALTVVCFLAVLYPYIANSKRVFGHYFYNVNSTFYVWYDNWPKASVGPYMHGDGVGWPTMPDEELMDPVKYWRLHSVGQILGRFEGGFRDMLNRSYATYWYLKYVVLYVGIAVALIGANRPAFSALFREHAALATFLLLYAAVYLPAIAFYEPTSGTGTTRFLMAHLTPFFFAVSWLAARRPFADCGWQIGGTVVTATHLQLLVLATMGLDLVFTLWPRLMTTYGGF